MVNNNNLVPIEAKKPFETVQELKNEIPTYEEFMKTYEANGNLNYDDLNEMQKGYGPCGKMLQTEVRDRSGNYVCTLYGDVRFFLEVDCLNWGGGGGCTRYFTSTSLALDYAHELERGRYSNVSHEVELKCAILIRDAIRHYEKGNRVDGYIKVQGNFWGGYESSCSY